MRTLFVLLVQLLTLSVSAQSADSLAAHRERYKADLAQNIQIDTSKVDFYPFRSQFIVTAQVQLLEGQPEFQMTTSSGMRKGAQKMARLVFMFKGKRYTLYGYQLTKLKATEEYATHFFVPFKDGTTGKATYGSGRYLDFRLEDIQSGKMLIDFNKAYNPYCAFTDGYNCPIPPAENHLGLPVTAGEKKFRGPRREQ